jgi:ethanolamine ammonia-lyase small subunit
MADDTPAVWNDLRRLTAARIGLQRTGASLSTAPLLDFRLAHARARDAVHEKLDQARLAADIAGLGVPVLQAASAVTDRPQYLLHPDLGRRLADDDAAALACFTGQYDVAIAVTDGLSARAVQMHAQPTLSYLLPILRAEGMRLAPVTVVGQGRVAIGDAIATALGADSLVVLIGERPGLTAPDSMGAYLTWRPNATTTDAERNCISNIRPEGIGYADAARNLAHLLRAMRTRQVSGVQLKDDSDRLQLGATIEGANPGAGSAS